MNTLSQPKESRETTCEELREQIRQDDRELWRKSLILAALENLMKFDGDATARAVYRARYLDLTDGRLPQ